jgi:alkylation response protein AidB-like acyl-CoA dehydrogenase
VRLIRASDRRNRKEPHAIFSQPRTVGTPRRRCGIRGDCDPAVWARLADELGVVGLTVPEHLGGSGASLVDLIVVVEQLARHLYSGPFLTTSLVQRALLRTCQTDARDRQLRELATGDAAATVALSNRGVCITSGNGGSDILVTAELRTVLSAPECKFVLVPVSAPEDLVLMAAIDPGAVTRRAALDPTRTIGDVSLRSAPAVVYARGESAVRARGELRDDGRLLAAAELIGISKACLDMSVKHAQVREQFGRPLGSFQAIKHRCADTYVWLEAAWSATYYAAWIADQQPHDRAMACRSAYLLADRCARMATSTAHQVHGAMAFTWEHDTHLYLKRSRAVALLMGAGHQELDRIASALLDGPEDGANAVES